MLAIMKVVIKKCYFKCLTILKYIQQHLAV